MDERYLREAKRGFDKWLKLVGYVAFFWWLLDMIKYLPPEIADRVIEAVLKKLGI